MGGDDLWYDCDWTETEEPIDLLCAMSRDGETIRRAALSFIGYDLSAECFLDALIASGPAAFLDASPEVRVAENGGIYSQEQFVKWYAMERTKGLLQWSVGQKMWEDATQWSPAKRADVNGQQYTLAEFEQ